MSHMMFSVVLAGTVVAASFSVVQGGTTSPNDTTVIPRRLTAVPAGQVHDLGGFIGERYRLNTEDRLLGDLGFEHEKLLRKIEEKKTAEWTFIGEHPGKWLEAAIWSAQVTGNAALRAKAGETLRRMIAAQEPDGYLGITATSLRTAAQPLRGMDPYEQYFTLHALITAYEAWGSPPALEAAKKLADYYVNTIGSGKAEFWPKPENRQNGCGTIAGHAAHQCLEGTLFIDPMMRLYQTTGEKRYLEWTQWVVNNINRWGKMNDPQLNVFDDLDLVADGKKHIGAIKSWSHSHTWHMNFMGFLRLYQATGDASLLHKVEGAMRDIMSRQVFATGAVSVHECYQEDQLLPNGEAVAETCASMSWLELNQYLLELTADPTYADIIERVMVNHLPAAQASDGGGFRYHTALVGTRGRTMGGSTCCQGSGHRATAELPRFFYATDKDGLYVNQYVASSVNVKLSSGTKVTLKQTTGYPSDEKVRIEVTPEKAEQFTMRFRLPSWCSKPSLRVNGTPVVDLKPRTYAAVKREWKTGDVVELHLSMAPQWVKGEYNNSGLVYLKRGPVVYMVDGTLVEGGLWDLLSMEAVAVDTRVAPVVEPLPAGFLGPALAVPIRVVDKPATIVKMVPFANVGRWYVDEADKEKHPGRNLYGAWLAPVGSARNAAAVAIEVSRRVDLPYVIDRTGPSFKDEEHNPQNGQQKPKGWSHLGYRTRHSDDWFSWDLKVLPDVPIILRVGCSGGEFGSAKFEFDVLVDGQKVGEMTVPTPEGRVDGVFALPAELTKGKDKIAVRFQAHPGMQAGRVFDVLTIKGGSVAAVKTRLDPVPTMLYKVDSPLWSERLKQQIVNWIPHCIAKLSEPGLKEGGIENFTEAGNKNAGRPYKPHISAPWSNAYTLNTVEAMCLAQMVDAQGDAEILKAQKEMRSKLDEWIPIILAAQEPDGYLQTLFTLGSAADHKNKRTPERWRHVGAHEGYVAGYFLDAAVAHFRMTEGRDRRMYDAAKKLADCWDANLGPAPKRRWYDGHEGMEQSLVRFARLVNEVEGSGKGDKYILLSKFLLDSRYGGKSYDQSHLPVVEQTEALGHAVRAVYLYSAMTDIAMETGDAAYHRAVKSLWNSLVNSKYYVTGGVGSGETTEGFGEGYSLPNKAYSESCSDCGELFFQHKMNLAYHEARYADLMEETLYNAILGSVDLSGKNFTYTNPLDQHHARYPWHGCPCCIGNIPRTLLMLPTWMYARNEDALFVNLYIGSAVRVGRVAGADVEVVQRTEYPWKGGVEMVVKPTIAKTFSLHLRIPTRDVSTLYRSEPAANGILSLAVNGKSLVPVIKDGYAVITREWKSGDTVSFEIPLRVQRVKADERVVADRGRVALRYGPLVYNIESVDQKIDGTLKSDAELVPRWEPNLLGGVVAIHGKFADGSPLTAIPNYARNNRGGRSIVWIEEAVK